MHNQKLLVILGPTASGKSALAVDLALKFGGEVVSADSRQVYKGLDIGTGKITREEMRGVPHHLLNVAAPEQILSVADYQKLARHAIADIHTRGKLPILCGGTGFYIESVVDDVIYPDVLPNAEFRLSCEKYSNDDLFQKLAATDPERAQALGISNRMKIIRALEIIEKVGKVPELKKSSSYDALQIGIMTEDELLRKKIRTRLIDRINAGMIEEARSLHAAGLFYERMDRLGLEYRYLAKFLKGELTEEQMVEILATRIWQYARRQKTWFRRDKRIEWYALDDTEKIINRVRQFVDNAI